MHYPTKSQLDQMGETLQRDVCLCLRTWFGRPHVQAVRIDRERPPAPGHFSHKRAGKRIA